MSYQRDFDRRVRVAMIGAGSHTYRNLLPALNYLPADLQLLCVRSDMNRAARTAAQYGCRAEADLQRVLDDPSIEAVLVCLPPAIQAEVAAAALAHGKHVWLEKPPGLSSEQVRDMLAKRGDRVAVVGFKKAFMPVTDKAIEIATAADFGNLRSILAIYPSFIPNADSTPEPDKVTDWLLNGVHPISFALAVGGRPCSVQAVVNDMGHGSCCITFRNGVIGNLHLASGPMPMESYYLFGDRWHLDIYNNNRITLQRGVPTVYGKTTQFAPAGIDSGAIVWEASNCHASLENKALFTQGIYNELAHFFDAILAGRAASRGTLEFALDVMRVYEGAQQSRGNKVLLN